MVFDNKELLEVAYVVKPHGLKGHLSVKIFEDFSNSILNENIPVFLDIEGIPVPFFIEDIKSNSTNSIIKFKYIDSGDSANKFKLSSIYIFNDDLKNDDAEPANDDDFELSGFDVFDNNYGYIGKITNLNIIPGNPVFETELNGKTIIIPYSKDFIEDIDYEAEKIKINAPEGLINLYLGDGE